MARLDRSIGFEVPAFLGAFLVVEQGHRAAAPDGAVAEHLERML